MSATGVEDGGVSCSADETVLGPAPDFYVTCARALTPLSTDKRLTRHRRSRSPSPTARHEPCRSSTDGSRQPCHSRSTQQPTQSPSTPPLHTTPPARWWPSSTQHRLTAPGYPRTSKARLHRRRLDPVSPPPRRERVALRLVPGERRTGFSSKASVARPQRQGARPGTEPANRLPAVRAARGRRENSRSGSGSGPTRVRSACQRSGASTDVRPLTARR